MGQQPDLQHRDKIKVMVTTTGQGCSLDSQTLLLKNPDWEEQMRVYMKKIQIF